MSRGEETRVRPEQLRLYFVSPDGWGTQADDEVRLHRVLERGVSAVQFRDKSSAPARVQRAQRMRRIVHAHHALFIVNDDPYLAKRVDADGVHVGTSDVSVHDARAVLGAGKIVGATARTYIRAQTVVNAGADYLGVGAVYNARPSKGDAVTIGLDGLRRICARFEEIPVVAIGGITVATADDCYAAGAAGVAMIRGLWGPSEQAES